MFRKNTSAGDIVKNMVKIGILSLLALTVAALAAPASAMGPMGSQPPVSGTTGTTVPYSTYTYAPSSTVPYTTYTSYTPGQTGPVTTTPVSTATTYQYGWLQGLSHGLSASEGYDLGYALGSKATSYNPPKCQLSAEYCNAVQQGYTNAYYSGDRARHFSAAAIARPLPDHPDQVGKVVGHDGYNGADTGRF